ncbi:hypothetical protein VTK73DRAFT_404 [Phialemonium thermophilum]|uniref:Alkaline phosphatase n=1 Tax=Phialemonium thermophilum TaxID=223376 RepID=A0ABR3XFG2_9PEZI
MTSARTPLLTDPRRSSRDSEDLAEQDETDLHDEQAYTVLQRLRGAIWTANIRQILLFSWALLATAAVIVLAVWTQHQEQTKPSAAKPEGKRNLIFMVSDGMGPASLSMTRSFRQLVEDLPADDVLTLDRHFWGTSRTRSSMSLVTDSAAGATAFSCGKKSYNGAISMTPEYDPCGTVLEAAKRAGYATGLVVTTDVTDATPACFASHVYWRVQNDEIALQEVGNGPLGRVVDLILGGGRCHFLPNSTDGSCRTDDVDVTKVAQEKHGWSYFDDRAGFDSLWEGKNVSLPVLGLFAPTDIPFEIDRRNLSHIYPSLSEMAVTALNALEAATKDSEKGFFLMIEGSRIDHTGHINDPATQVREVLEYDKAFKAVVDFLDRSKTPGVLVATSDHETGGLSTAYQRPGELPVYNWNPSVLAKVNASSERLASLLQEHVKSTGNESKSELKNWINESLVIPHLGIKNARDSELDAIASHPDVAVTAFAHMVSSRARIGWSSHGHSAIDVNVYSSGGPGTENIRGNVENTEIGKFLREYLAVDVDKITEELKTKMDLPRPQQLMDDGVLVPEPVDTEGHPWQWIFEGP